MSDKYENFIQLSELWKKETSMVSNPKEILSNISYRTIVSNKENLPFIFNDLKENGGEWFQALEEMTGQDPIDPVSYGDYERIRYVWIKWGEQNGFL